MISQWRRRENYIYEQVPNQISRSSPRSRPRSQTIKIFLLPSGYKFHVVVMIKINMIIMTMVVIIRAALIINVIVITTKIIMMVIIMMIIIIIMITTTTTPPPILTFYCHGKCISHHIWSAIYSCVSNGRRTNGEIRTGVVAWRNCYQSRVVICAGFRPRYGSGCQTTVCVLGDIIWYARNNRTSCICGLVVSFIDRRNTYALWCVWNVLLWVLCI